MTLALALLGLASFGYLLAAVGFQWNLFRERRQDWRPWINLLLGAHAVHTLALGLLTYQLGHLPMARMDEAIGTLAWLLIGLYVALGRRWKVEVVGTVAAPAACVMTAFAAVALASDTSVPARGAWLLVHVGSLIASYAAFTLAAACAGLYFWQARHLKRKKLTGTFRMLPSLDTLDRSAYRFILGGFPLMVLGIVSGLIISNWRWTWDPKETLVAVTCGVFATYLHLRIAGWQGRPVNLVLLVAFLCVMLSFLVRGQVHSG